jgi:hypothetical protein
MILFNYLYPDFTRINGNLLLITWTVFESSRIDIETFLDVGLVE